MKYSILFKNEYELNKNMPDFFVNINADQVVNNILRDDNGNLPIFYTPLKSEEDIKYRQDIFKDLDNRDVYVEYNSAISRLKKIYESFKANEYEANTSWAGKRTLLKQIDAYIKTINSFRDFLSTSDLIKSEGLKNLCKYLIEFTSKNEYKELEKNLETVKNIVNGMRYTLVFNGCDIYVSKYIEEDKDFTPFISDALKGFNWDSKREFNYTVNEMVSSRLIDHNVLNCLSKIYKEEFKALQAFCHLYKNFYDLDLYRIVLEAKFYTSVHFYFEKLESTGLQFCYPEFTPDFNEESIDSFDLALAYRLMNRGEKIVTNSYSLNENERAIILSGPNQGGKTTFARQLGELHYFALLGIKVPGSYARLHLIDSLYTIFKTEEAMESLNGKLQSELVMVHDIIGKATKDSFLIFNEIFASTTSLDGYELTKKLIDSIEKIGCMCLFITFIDELSSISKITVAMRSNVSKENPMIRTYKITKEESNGKAYANAISLKHHLAYDEIRRRIK